MTTRFSSAEEANTLSALKKLGLTDIDAGVYVHLLERGTPLMGSKIAARLSLHRQYVYASLQKLLRMGLIEEVPSGARSKYKALPPQYLTHLARRQLEDAEFAARELERISSVGAEQDFEVYRGTRQVLEFERRFVEDLGDNETQYIIGGSTNAFLGFFAEHYEPLSRIAASKNIHSQYLASTADLKHLAFVQTIFDDFDFRVLPGMPETRMSTVIRFDALTFYAFGNPTIVYVLKSKTIADDYKRFFALLWNMAKPQSGDDKAHAG